MCAPTEHDVFHFLKPTILWPKVSNHQLVRSPNIYHTSQTASWDLNMMVIILESALASKVSSKDMSPLPGNFAPVFFQNQFRTTIPLPTKEEYPDMNGKCAIVTGSNIGLGFEAANQLLSLGLSHLVMGVRSLEKGNDAAATLRAANPAAIVEVWELDMESYSSIQKFAQSCQDKLSRIDVVILNAGLSPTEFNITPGTGHEKTVQVNHISTVLLTILLLLILKSKSSAGNPPRITVVNSDMAHLCKFPNKACRPLLSSFDDTAVTPFEPQERYGVSKLLCQLFLVKLAGEIDSDDVTINMVDPGLTKGTSLSRDAKRLIAVAAFLFIGIAGRPINRGAATYLDAALGQGKESHGCFLMNCKIAPLATLYYTHGEELSELIWSETLEELSSLGAEQIIASMRRSLS